MPISRKCFPCQFFEHLGQTCRRQAHGIPAICERCELIHDTQCIAKSSKCVNCSSSHLTSLKKYDRHLFKKVIVTLKTIEQLTFLEAHDCVLTRCVCPGVTFISILTRRFPQPTTNEFLTASRSSRSPFPQRVLYLLPMMPQLKFQLPQPLNS